MMRLIFYYYPCHLLPVHVLGFLTWYYTKQMALLGFQIKEQEIILSIFGKRKGADQQQNFFNTYN